jgi:hypothetical protein
MSEPRVSIALTVPDPEGRWRLGVVAKRTYLVRDKRLIEAPEQVSLVEGPLPDPSGLALLHDTDLILRKPAADVVVLGHVYPHEGERECALKVRVGQSTREIRVFGDRRIGLDHLGRARFSSPEPFEKLPLGWERAYGGYDAAALEAYGDPTVELREKAGVDAGPHFGLYAYPRNPAGRGYLVELSARALELTQLPNFEDPATLLRPDALVYGNSLAWPAYPVPASTAWLPYSFFPRSLLLGFAPPLFDSERFPPESFHEVRAGLIAPRTLHDDAHIATLYHANAAQGSAPGLRFPSIEPGETLELSNLHPRGRVWQFNLPAAAPLILTRIKDEAPVTVQASIRTLVIEPDLDRVAIVWVAERPIQTPLTPEQLAAVHHAVSWR